MLSKNIKIFNGQGRLLQMTEDEGILRTTLHVPKVSVGLSEVVQLFLLEKCIALSPQHRIPMETFSKPFSSTGNLEVTVEGDPSFSLFEVYTEEGIPYISTARDGSFPFDGVEYAPTYDANGLTAIQNLNQEPMSIRMTFNPIEEGEAYGIVKLYGQNFKAEIELYAEAENEDIRFAKMLENFGRTFGHTDELIVRESDINEDLPDWKRVNQKRKELLLTGHEIYSHIGSVKGLLNALKFFGYQDLTVKEFWLNVRKNDIDNGKLISNKLGQDYRMIEAGGFKKTDMIGLFYPINKVTDDLDDYGMPVVVDAFMFTQEEVLMKLFALREKLRKEFLPPFVRITDITGEGVYFAHYKVNAWSDKNKHLEVIEGESFDVAISQPVGYLQDLRPFVPVEYPQGVKLPLERFDDDDMEIYTNSVKPYAGGQRYSAEEVPKLVETILKFSSQVRYDYPWIGKESVFEGEQLDVPIGYPFVMECIVPHTLWADITGATFKNLSKHFTWKNISLRQHYEIEWKITRIGGGYEFVFRGLAENYLKFPHFLPKPGEYDVQCRLINMDNHSSLKIIDKAVTVYQKSLEVLAVVKYSEGVRSWKDLTFKWSDASGTLSNPSISGRQDSTLPNVLLDPYAYKNESWKIYENQTIEDFKTVPFYKNRLGHTLTWANTDATWGECKKLSFKETKLHTEHLGGFKLTLVNKDDVLSIGNLGSHTIVGVTHADIVEELNNSIEDGIERFFYSLHVDGIKAEARVAGNYGWHFVKLKKKLATIETQSWESPDWLGHAMMRIMNKYPDVPKQDWFLDAPVADIIAGKVNNIDYWIAKGAISKKNGRGTMPSFAGSSSWGDQGMKVYNNPFKSPQHVPIFLVMDSSEVYGKHDIIWNVKKVLDDGTEVDYMTVVDGTYLVLRLKDPAVYTIEVELNDSNKNRVTKRLPGFIEITKDK